MSFGMLVSLVNPFCVSAEDNYCAKFINHLDNCEVEGDVNMKCEENLLIMGGDVISTSLESGVLIRNLEFDFNYEHKIDHIGKGKYRILCVKKTAKGLWRSLKEIADRDIGKIINPYLQKKSSQLKSVVTRGGDSGKVGQSEIFSEKERWVLIPNHPFLIKNSGSESCGIEIADIHGSTKIKEIVPPGDTFRVSQEQVGMTTRQEYILKKTCGNVAENTTLIVLSDENTLAIGEAVSEIENNTVYSGDEKRMLTMEYLGRIQELYPYVNLQWWVDCLESSRSGNIK